MKGNFKKYIRFMKPYLKYEILIYILISISSILALANPVLLQVIIDKILILRQVYLLKYVLLIFAAFYLLDVLIQYVNGFLNMYLGQMISIKLRRQLLKHIQKVKMEELLESKSGDLISKITDDVSTVTAFLTSTVISVATYSFNLLASALFMLYIGSKLAVIAFIIAAVQLLISVKFSKITRKNQQAVREKSAVHLGFLKQFLTSIKFIKAYDREKYFEINYNKILNDLLHLSFKNFYINFSYNTCMSMVSFLGSMSIFSFGVYFIVNGDMSVGALFVFDMVSERFYQFASGLVNLNISLQGVIVSLQRLESILNMEKEEFDGSRNEPESKTIRLENVSFKYSNEDDKNVLNSMSFEFKEGETYALVGSSGDGKTTIMNLLLRFYSPQCGGILLGDRDLTEMDLRYLRRRISPVFQDVLLIDGTIEDNIRFGSKKAKAEGIKRAAQICCVDEFVKELPQGYQTKVGEKGEKLSAGQRQRICLARAMLDDADIYIFDEAFANLDKRVEMKVFENLQKALKGKTQIYIGHNLKLIKNINNIVVIDKGKVEAAGRHEWLLEKSDMYRELYTRGENEIKENKHVEAV